jgi:hypothetical protein
MNGCDTWSASECGIFEFMTEPRHEADNGMSALRRPPGGFGG